MTNDFTEIYLLIYLEKCYSISKQTSAPSLVINLAGFFLFQSLLRQEELREQEWNTIRPCDNRQVNLFFFYVGVVEREKHEHGKNPSQFSQPELGNAESKGIATKWCPEGEEIDKGKTTSCGQTDIAVLQMGEPSSLKIVQQFVD